MRDKILIIAGGEDPTCGAWSALQCEGYQVDCIDSGVDAIREVLVTRPDLVVLALQPCEDGWRYCQQLRALVDRPLLLLLSSTERLHRTQGLDLGADDCMTLPILGVELVARVRALLRRRDAGLLPRRDIYFVDGNLVVDLGRREVCLDGRPLRLTPNEYRILACLIQHEGEVVTPERLLAQLGHGAALHPGTVLKQYIHHLRLKLEQDPHQPQRIVTWRGEGYMLRRLDARSRPG